MFEPHGEEEHERKFEEKVLKELSEEDKLLHEILKNQQQQNTVTGGSIRQVA